MRFLLSTCWLIGAGGGWALGLAGLSAGARGVSPLTDLIVLGGAASWVGMLITAFRPGKEPNLWQKLLTGTSWFMPVTMVLLRDSFDSSLVLLSVASAACVTIIVVVYPSQSYSPSLNLDPAMDSRLARIANSAKEEAQSKEKLAATEAINGFVPRREVWDERSGDVPVGAPEGVSVDVPTEPSAAGPSSAPSLPADAVLPPDATAYGGNRDEDAESASNSKWVAPSTKRRGRLGSSRYRGDS